MYCVYDDKLLKLSFVLFLSDQISLSKNQIKFKKNTVDPRLDELLKILLIPVSILISINFL